MIDGYFLSVEKIYSIHQSSSGIVSYN